VEGDGDDEFVVCADEVGRPLGIVKLAVDGMAHAAAARTTVAAANPANALRQTLRASGLDSRSRSLGVLKLIERPLGMKQRAPQRRHDRPRGIKLLKGFFRSQAPASKLGGAVPVHAALPSPCPEWNARVTET
jgi:hypothetical protein